MIKKLRIKFILINMTIIIVMLCIIMLLVFGFTKSNLENQSINMMQSIAARPPDISAQGHPPNAPYAPYVSVDIDHKGEKTITSDGEYMDTLDEEFLDKIADIAGTLKDNKGIVDKYNLRYYKVITPMGERIIFMDISGEKNTLKTLMKNMIVIGIVSLIVFLAASIVLSGWAVKPIKKSLEQQRQFVADASHELKTPLTVIITNAELAANPQYDDNERRKFIDNINIMSAQMKRLVLQLLELARADNAASDRQLSEVQFSKVIYDAVLPFEPVFFENGQPLSVDIEENILVMGDENELRHVAEILLDNARKYSVPGGCVSVELHRRNSTNCLLTVSNEGEPIPEKSLNDLFKRFYRADEARERTGSYGLGLSIAESIIKGCKGKIWAESRNGKNSFYVQLQCK